MPKLLAKGVHMDLLQKLIEKRKAALDEITALKEQRTEITDLVAKEERDDLNEEEAASHRSLTADIKAKNAIVDDLNEQIRDLEDEAERAGKNDAETRRIAKSSVKVTSEARTYERGNGKSYVQDLLARHFGVGDDEAQSRLQRHAAEARALDRTDGTGGFHTVATAAA